jgi:hypothetical protein
MKKLYIPAVALMAMSSSALAWDVTFERDAAATYSSGQFNLVVQIAQQPPSGEAQQTCYINWDHTSCTVTGFPSTTNALVTVSQRTSTSGAESSVIGKIQFWVGVFNDSTVHIPTGQISFITDKNWSELVSLSGLAIAILPQGLINEGGVLSDRPNGGTAYFGQRVSNCGPKELSSNYGPCPVSFLAGCYSPVFARPSTGTPAKIWVNRTVDSDTSNVMCVGDGENTDYLINVQ